MIEKTAVQTLIDLALAEDVATGDVTSGAIFGDTDRSRARIIAKESGIFCGAFMVSYVYDTITASHTIINHVQEGARVKAGDCVISIEGPTLSLLEGERTALNFIQRTSAIATRTALLVDICKGSTISILDTRKTLPGFRLLDKYAVTCGGGSNHRMGLHDMVLIKDNHIHAAGSITKAVSAVRGKYARKYKVEVETTTLEEVSEALYCGADIIMLDNMDKEQMGRAVDIINGRAKIEVSGNYDERKLETVTDLKIDFVSVGALTHSVKAFDLSMKFE